MTNTVKEVPMFGTSNHVLHDGHSKHDHSVDGVLRYINQTNMPALVHSAVFSLTGNRKAAKKAGRAVAKALRNGKRSLARDGRRSASAKWVAVALLGGAAAAAVLVWRRLPRHEEPAQTTHPPYKPEGLAGGMSP